MGQLLSWQSRAEQLRALSACLPTRVPVFVYVATGLTFVPFVNHTSPLILSGAADVQGQQYGSPLQWCAWARHWLITGMRCSCLQISTSHGPAQHRTIHPASAKSPATAWLIICQYVMAAGEQATRVCDLPLPALELIYQSIDASARNALLRTSRWGRDFVLLEARSISLKVHDGDQQAGRLQLLLQLFAGAIRGATVPHRRSFTHSFSIGIYNPQQNQRQLLTDLLAPAVDQQLQWTSVRTLTINVGVLGCMMVKHLRHISIYFPCLHLRCPSTGATKWDSKDGLPSAASSCRVPSSTKAGAVQNVTHVPRPAPSVSVYSAALSSLQVVQCTKGSTP
jgi:hypothetical protein